jgi:phospholipid/cholesterol/gamma-HCH transport system ATP-binding protein
MNGKAEIIIEIKGLRTSIGRQLIHDGLDLQVHRGEVLGLVGASGSGKSVLLRTIVGLIQPELGTVEVLGHSMIGISDTARRTLVREFGVLFQDGALFSSLTVAENIKVPLIEHLGMPPALADQIAALKLALVGLPASAGPKFPSELSGGMRKRAGLARALAADPAILFLDEPTAGLDPIGAAAFDQLIKELQQTLGLTVFIVTHDLDSLVAICDRIAVLADRRVLVIGDFERMLRETHPWIREYFHGPRARAAVRDGR